MNKKMIALVAVLIVICLIAFLLIVKNSSKKVETPIEEQVVILSENVIVSTKETNHNNSQYDVNIKAPEFNNLSSSFNTYINNKINTELSYINLYNEMVAGIEDKENIGKFIYDVSYERHNCGDIVSVVVNQHAVLEGNREKNLIKCYIIDAKNNKTALLQDVMANKADYKRKVKAEVETQAFKNNIELKGGNGIGSISDTQKFYIKNDILHICFDEAEVAPASAGILDFEMPFKLENGLFVY